MSIPPISSTPSQDLPVGMGVIEPLALSQTSPPTHISALPTTVIAEIASYLCLKDQSALAVAATSKYTENVREGIALARVDFLNDIWHAISNGLIAHDCMYSYPDKPRRDDHGAIQEVFSMLHTYSLVVIGDALGIRNFKHIYTKAALLEAGRAVSEKLTKEPPPINTLDLSSKHLTFFPIEVTKLQKLEFLDLSHNGIAALPAEIGNCMHLTKLTLVGNQLIKLPEEFGKLTGLQYLDLCRNKIRACPLQLENLTELTMLDLSHNPLTITPDDIGFFLKMKKLTSLNLSVDQVKNSLPGIIEGEREFHRINVDAPTLTVWLFV